MTAILVTWLAPLAAALLLSVRVAPIGAVVATGAVTSLVAAQWLVLQVSGGGQYVVRFAGLPDMPLVIGATPLTATLSFLVALISAIVLVYALGYMREDPERRRFFVTLLGFVSAMQTLVLGQDWLSLIAGWELIGFCSFLLIGFWHERPGVADAANRAFLYTRTLDLGLFVGAFILIGASGSSLIADTLSSPAPAATFAGIALLLAAMGKSAQVPFQFWLQRAMAGPTPVSALLHSATLVAAGAILLVRTAPLFQPGMLTVIAIIGGLTTIIAGLTAFAQRDLKGLLAASTSSQYGLMLVGVGAGAPLTGLLHLITHAIIKSGLFLGAGIFQHDRHSTEFSALGGAGRRRKAEFVSFAILALALSGVPPLAGYFSKDAIISATLRAPSAGILLPMTLAGTVLTGAYMARALRLVWRGEASGIAPLSNWMRAGIYTLALLSVVAGFALSPIEHFVGGEVPQAGFAWILGLGAAISGLLFGWFVTAARALGRFRSWAEDNFVVAGGMDRLVARPVLALAALCETVEGWINRMVFAVGGASLRAGLGIFSFDVRAIDRTVFSLARSLIVTGQKARRLQSGFIHKELAVSVLGLAILAAILLFTPVMR